MNYLERGNAIGVALAVPSFIAAWIYCIATYGFLLGVGLGWLPAAITAVAVWGFTVIAWPLLIFAAAALALFLAVNW